MLGGRARFCDSLSFDDADALPTVFLLFPEEEEVPVSVEEVAISVPADEVFPPAAFALTRVFDQTGEAIPAALAVHCGDLRRNIEHHQLLLVGLVLLANEQEATVERTRGECIGCCLDEGG